MAARVTRAQELGRLVELVVEKLAAAEATTGAFDFGDYDAFRRRSKAADERLLSDLAAEGAVFSDRVGSEHVVRLAGIRSSSTSGIRGALNNWRRAAEKAIAGTVVS